MNIYDIIIVQKSIEIRKINQLNKRHGTFDWALEVTHTVNSYIIKIQVNYHRNQAITIKINEKNEIGKDHNHTPTSNHFNTALNILPDRPLHNLLLQREKHIQLHTVLMYEQICSFEVAICQFSIWFCTEPQQKHIYAIKNNKKLQNRK